MDTHWFNELHDFVQYGKCSLVLFQVIEYDGVIVVYYALIHIVQGSNVI